jgi:hypothetical protein
VITAASCWQCSGVSFRTTDRPVSPLLESREPPDLVFEIGATPVWSDADWEAAEVLGRSARLPSNQPIEIRRAGAKWFYRVPWTGDLCLEPKRIRGCLSGPDARLGLEMEFLEHALALHLSRAGVPVFHAAAVECDGGALALVAPSGGGKSSLTLGLIRAGCGFLSDDLIAAHGPKRLVHPSHFNARLRADTAAALLPDDLHRGIHPGFPRSKRVTNVSAWGRVQTSPCPLTTLYLIEGQAGREPARMEPAPPALALQTLVNSRIGFDPRPPAERLPGLVELLRQVTVRRIFVPRSYDRLAETCAALMRDARRCQARTAS